MIIFDLPQELIEEILSMVPMISLKRLRSECKQLKDLLKDPRFIKKQIAYARSNRQYHVLVVVKFKVYSMCSYINEINMTAPPLFKRGLNLIDPCLNSEVDLGQAFHCDGMLLCAKFEIYEFTTKSWRNLDVSPKGNLQSRGVSLKGDVYWLFKRTKRNKYSLLSFDFSTETLQYLYVPFEMRVCIHATMALSVVREKHLSLLHQRGSTQKMEIWISSEIETTYVSWNKFLTVDFTPHPHMFSCHMSFFIDEEKKVAVCCEKEQENRILNKVYIVGEDEYKVSPGFEFNDSRSIYCSPTMFGYVPRLV
ncbi:hypothetical protein CARUB_v10028268mg [Capsella rubella]|uniref:F-box domain-containing protein n=1 Tax=Capsella rubella TaxID=81985 RepID=R0GRF4_9BRAS|nr:hypothetical protein CARUB_v10028268mg [Capsella rubella]